MNIRTSQQLKIIVILLFILASFSGAISPALHSQENMLPQGPELHQVSFDQAPLYFFLFTHTEDHINHELSEERYWRVGPMIEALDASYPELNVSWMIEFQGADAQSVSERNSQTGLVDYLLELNSQGLVEFGYHAHHDPTYLNRPQRTLGPAPTYQEAYEALHTWITCEKEPIRGGCVNDTGGGLQAILNNFGSVDIVTGVGLNEGALIERSAGSAAIRNELPDRLLNFGFPDHGSIITNPDYIEARNRLLEILTPTNDTGSSMYWIDNALSITDGAPLEGVNNIQIKEGIPAVEEFISEADLTRPMIAKGGIAGKYLYTASGTSPTIWGYSHPDDPELPDEWLNPPNLKERYYVQTEQALGHLAEFMRERGTRFVDAQGVIDLYTSENYWDVTPRELEQIALWLLDNWTDAPPNYAYDGLNFYSLTDAYFLLAAGLNDQSTEGLVSTQIGPWSAAQQNREVVNIPTALLRDWIGDIERDVAIPELINLTGTEYSPAQILYAMALLYAREMNDLPTNLLRIPAMASVPETYHLLAELDCRDCLDTAWSLKPARFQGF